MIQLTDKTYYFVPPEGATNFGWREGKFTCQLPESPPNTYHWLTDADDFMKRIGGNWRYICTSKGITENDAANIVQWFEIINERGYRDYMGADPFRYPFKNPVYSFNSLIASKGLDENKNYCLIEKCKR